MSGALKIRTIPGDIGSSDRKQRCGNCSIAKLSSKGGNAQSVMGNSPTTTTSYPTMKIPRGWEGRGGMTIRRIFEQLIGGATRRKVRLESTTDDNRAHREEPRQSRLFSRGCCPWYAGLRSQHPLSPTFGWCPNSALIYLLLRFSAHAAPCVERLCIIRSRFRLRLRTVDTEQS